MIFMPLTHLDCLNLAHWLHNTASEDGLGPICFSIVDAQGELLWFERMDRAPARSITIAIAKAYTAVRMNDSTMAFKQRLENEKLSCSDFMDERFTALPGGSPLVSSDGSTAGAIGISGRHTDSDQQLADAAAAYFYTL